MLKRHSSINRNGTGARWNSVPSVYVESRVACFSVILFMLIMSKMPNWPTIYNTIHLCYQTGKHGKT